MPEDKFIDLENGEKIAVTYAESESNKWVFVCHGFGGNRHRQSEYLKLAEEGLNVVTLDFRGNGDSSGDFINQTLSSRIQDLEAAVDFFNPGKYVLFGTSFGGKVVFHAAPELNPGWIIVKSPVTYNETMQKFRSVVEEKGEFEFIEGKPIDKRFIDDLEEYSFDSLDIDVPVAIIHGADDTTVHPEYSFQAAQSLDTDVMLQKLKGEEHSFTEEKKDYMFRLMVVWLESNGFS
jgi:pimeloyl-ACP methyl ester carboxylesterase